MKNQVKCGSPNWKVTHNAGSIIGRVKHLFIPLREGGGASP